MQRHDAAGHARKLDLAKAGRADHVGEDRWWRKLADRLGEVAIGFGIAGDHATERRADVERVEIINPVEARHIHVRELEAEKVPAWAQHAERLRQRGVDTWHVADPE